MSLTADSESLYTTVNSLFTWIVGVNPIDRTLQEAATGLDALLKVLRLVDVELIAFARHSSSSESNEENRDLRRTLSRTLLECRETVTQLERALWHLGYIGRNGTMDELNLTSKDSSIAASKDRIALHVKSLSMALRMLELSNSFAVATLVPSTTRRSSSVQATCALMEAQISMLQELMKNVSTTPTLNPGIIHQYARRVSYSAQSLLSAASDITGNTQFMASMSEVACHVVDGDQGAEHGLTQDPGQFSVSLKWEETAGLNKWLENASTYGGDDMETLLTTAASSASSAMILSSIVPSLESGPGVNCDNVQVTKSRPDCVRTVSTSTTESFKLPLSRPGCPRTISHSTTESRMDRNYVEDFLRSRGIDIRTKNFDPLGAFMHIFQLHRKIGVQPDEDATAVMKQLLGLGANPAARLPSLWKHFQKMQPVGFRPNQEQDLLTAATCEGWEGIVSILLEKGAPVNNDSPPALHIAARLGSPTIVRLLLSAGADVQATSRDGITALHIAADIGHVEIVNDLLRAGIGYDDVAFWHVGSKVECTALHLAVRNKHMDVVRTLLEAGANADGEAAAGPECSPPPLHLACQEPNPTLVQLLLEKGANASLLDKYGQTPLSLTKSRFSLGGRSSRSSDFKNFNRACQDTIQLLQDAGATSKQAESSEIAHLGVRSATSDDSGRGSLRKFFMKRTASQASPTSSVTS